MAPVKRSSASAGRFTTAVSSAHPSLRAGMMWVRSRGTRQMTPATTMMNAKPAASCQLSGRRMELAGLGKQDVDGQSQDGDAQDGLAIDRRQLQQVLDALDPSFHQVSRDQSRCGEDALSTSRSSPSTTSASAKTALFPPDGT